MREDFPTARVEVKGAAARFAHLRAVLRHHSAVAGRVTARVARGVFTVGCGFGLLAWLAMHASTPRHYQVDVPRLDRFQMPAYDVAKMQQELQAIERVEAMRLQHLDYPAMQPIQPLQVEPMPPMPPLPQLELSARPLPPVVLPAPPPTTPITAHDLQHALAP